VLVFVLCNISCLGRICASCSLVVPGVGNADARARVGGVGERERDFEEIVGSDHERFRTREVSGVWGRLRCGWSWTSLGRVWL